MTEWIAAKLREMRGEGDETISYDKLAVDLGIKKPQVHDLVKGKGGAGQKVEQAFADKFFSGSIDKLRKTAREWWTKRNSLVHGIGPELKTQADKVGSPPYLIRQIIEEPPRYAALQRVLENPANAKKWSLAAVAAARSMQLDADADPGEAWWTRTLNGLEVAIATSIKMAGDPLEDIDKPLARKNPVRTTREKR